MNEDMSAFIEEMKPDRWKVFQVLPLIGENCDTTKHSGTQMQAKKAVEQFLITDAEFNRFVDRHLQKLADPSILKAEDNATMKSSYIMIDEYGRFLDSSLGMKAPTRSILDVGIEKAAEELLSSAGGDGHTVFD